MAFPDAGVSLIDNFNRADGALNAGAGSTIWDSVTYGGGSPGLAVISNQMGATTTAGSQLSLFTTAAGFDAVVDIAVAGGVSASYLAWFFCVQNGTTGGWEAYWALITDQWKINKRVAGSTTNLTGPSGPVLVNGDKVGIHRVDDVIELHHYTAGAWNPTPIASVSGETSIPLGGAMAFDLQTTVWRLDNLSAGTVTGGGGGGGTTGTTLYVDADHAAATDTWTRGQVDATHPLKTIAQAAVLAQASATWADTIAIKPAVNADPSNTLDTHVYAGFVNGGGGTILPFGHNVGNQPIVVKGVKADGTQPANDSQRPRFLGFNTTALANWHFQDLHFGYEFNSGKDVLTATQQDRPTDLVFDRCMWTGGAMQITNAGNSAAAAGLMQWNNCEFTARISTFHGQGGRRMDGVGFRVINSSQAGEDFRVHYEWNDCEIHHVMGEDAFQMGTGAATQVDTWCHWNRCVWHDVSQLPDELNPADIHTDSVQLLGGPEYKFVRCEWYRITDAVIASDFHHGLIHFENCLIKGAAIDDVDPVTDFDRGTIVINAGIGLQIQGTDNLVMIHNTIVENGFSLGLLNYFKQPAVVTKRVMINNIIESVSNAGVVLDAASEDKGNLIGNWIGDYTMSGADIAGFTEFGTSGATIMEIADTPTASPASSAGAADARLPATDRVGRSRNLTTPDIGCHESPAGITAAARPPLVVSLTPSGSGASVSSVVRALLYPSPGHVVNAATVTGSSMFVKDPAGILLPTTSIAVGAVDGNGRQAVSLTVDGTLYPLVSYTATITTAVADDAGSHLTTGRSWSFTAAGPAPSPAVYHGDAPAGGGGGGGGWSVGLA